MIGVTSQQYQRILRTALAARYAKKPGAYGGSIMLLGDTGIGKTDSTEHAFDSVVCPKCGKHDVPVLPFYMSQMAVEDVKGLYVYSVQHDKVRLHPNPDFQLDSECPRVYFLDEFTTVNAPMQKASLEFTLKHAIGGTKLPHGSIVVLGGNRVVDAADVEDMVRPQRTRITFLEYQFSDDAWFDWAVKKGVHPYVVSYLHSKPSMIYKPDVNAQHGEPLPRTWERTSEIIHTFQQDDWEPLINGTIGEGSCVEFMAWTATAGTLMPIVDRVLAGENVAAPELSAQFFISSVLVDRFVKNPKLAERMCSYAIWSADKNPEAAAIMIKDGARVGKDKLMASPSWKKAVARLADYVV